MAAAEVEEEKDCGELEKEETRETVVFVLFKEAFEMRRGEACARPAPGAEFGSAVMEKEA